MRWTDRERAIRSKRGVWRRFRGPWTAKSAGKLTRNCSSRKKEGLRKRLASKDFCKKHPDLAVLLDKEGERLVTLRRRERALETLSMSDAVLRLGVRLIDRYEAVKRRMGYLDYDDLIERTLTLLDRGEMADWALYKLDGGIDHILLDEAQDLSPEQWRIVRLLSEEAFSGEGARSVSRTLFAVGDEKQSIYSFQGACPGEFRRMSAFFREKAKGAKKAWRDIELSRSLPVRAGPARDRRRVFRPGVRFRTTRLSIDAARDETG